MGRDPASSYLLVIMDNKWIASVYQCKTLERAKELARVLMEDMNFDGKTDDLAIFMTIPRDEMTQPLVRWQDLQMEWKK